MQEPHKALQSPFILRGCAAGRGKHRRLGARGFHPGYSPMDPSWFKDINAYISLINLIYLP